MTPRARTAVELLAGAVAVSVALIGTHRLYDGWVFVLAPVVGAFLATAVAALGHLRRLRPLLTALASAALLLLYAAYTTLDQTMPLGLPTPTTVRDFADGVVGGWRAVLDAPLPLGGSDTRPDVFFVFLPWLTSAVTAHIILRTRLSVIAAVPALTLYGLTLALGAPATRSSVALPVVLALVVLLLIALRSRPAHEPIGTSDADPYALPGRALVLGSVLALTCAAVTGVTVNALEDRADDPFDPRRYQDDRTVISESANPLLEVKAIRTLDEPQQIMIVDTESTGDALLVDRMAVATLDRFDGTSWQLDNSFTRSGAMLGPDQDPSANSLLVEQDVSLLRRRHPWLPAGRTAVEISLDGISYDADSEMILGPPAGGPLDYTVTSRVTLPTEDELVDATVASADAELIALPAEVPVSLRELAAELGAGREPYERAQTLVAFFRENFTVNPTAPAGHSLGRMADFALEARTGQSEQFAATFVLLARLQGLPSRVVVGYRLTEVVDGEVTVSREIDTTRFDAWAEVRFDDIGWVTFDPTPLGSAVINEDQPAPTTTQAIEVIERDVLPTEAGPTEADSDPDRDDGARSLPVLPVLALVILLVVGSVVAGVRISKQNRRNERELAGSAANRVLAAWYDVTDRLVEHGLDVTATMTVHDVTEAGVKRFDLPPNSELWQLLPRVSEAAYGPSKTTRRSAAAAWRSADRFRKELGGRRTLLQRLRASVSPRPFRRPDLPRRRSNR